MLALKARDADDRVQAEPCARLPEPGAQPLGQIEPAADELLDFGRHTQQILDQGHRALRVADLAADQPGMVEPESIRESIPVEQPWQAEASQGADVEPEAVLAGPVVLHLG